MSSSRLLDLLGVDLPIIQAPMAGSTTPEMVIAVGEAGGLGSLPSALYSREQLRAALDAVRAGTTRPINVNFFSHHYIVDLRPLLIAGIVALYWPTVLQARVFRARLRLPILASFLGVAVFIWIAEQIGTGTSTWIYPSQADEWHPVSAAKVGSWFLLMMISVVLVTWVYPPDPPDPPVTEPEPERTLPD